MTSSITTTGSPLVTRPITSPGNPARPRTFTGPRPTATVAGPATSGSVRISGASAAGFLVLLEVVFFFAAAGAVLVPAGDSPASKLVEIIAIKIKQKFFFITRQVEI